MALWESLLENFLPAAITAGATYVTNAGNSHALDRRTAEQNAVNKAEAERQRQFELEKLQMSLAAQAASAGGGNAAAMAGVKQRSYESAIEALLGGGANMHKGAELLVSGMQNPHRGGRR